MKLPQLSLRELLLLVALVAMSCGWWADHRRVTASENLWQKRAMTLKRCIEYLDKMPPDFFMGQTVYWRGNGDFGLSPKKPKEPFRETAQIMPDILSLVDAIEAEGYQIQWSDEREPRAILTRPPKPR